MVRRPRRWLVLVLLLLVPGLSRLALAEEPPQPTAAEQEEIRDLMKRLARGRHPTLRSQAAGALGGFGVKAEMAVPALVGALRDPDVSVSSAAAAALGRVGLHAKEAVRGLQDAVGRGRDPYLRAAAAEALGRIGAPGAPAVPALIEALGDETPELRREAAAALGTIADARSAAQAIRGLEGRLSDEEPLVQLAAAVALVQLGSQRPDLAGILGGAAQRRGTPVERRQAACEALGQLGPLASSAVPALIAALRERFENMPGLPYAEQRQQQHESFRRAAATALGRIGARDALPALRSAAGQEALREAASEAIARIEATAPPAAPAAEDDEE